MIKFWNKIGFIGVKRKKTKHARYVVLSNHVAALLVILCLVLSLMLRLFFGQPVSAPLAAGAALLIMPVWFINYLGQYNLSRFYLCIVPTTLVMVIALYVKSTRPLDVAEFEYYDSRLLLLAHSILPLIIFDYREKFRLFAGLMVGFLLLILYDPIHNLFSLGYFQTGHDSRNYLFINYAIIATYSFIIAAIMVLKAIITRTETKNVSLINELREKSDNLESKNSVLVGLNDQVASKNKAIQLQAEELEAGQEKILEANRIIEEQKNELKAKNRMLELKLQNQDKNMVGINTELVKRNNELRQFGYTISHNLRGPIASLLGLVNLFDVDEANYINKEIIRHVHEVTNNLDIVIKDLTRIVELRKDLMTEREEIDLEKECDVLASLLQEDLRKAGGQLNIKLVKTQVYGIKAYIHSSLYNLVSNSIKFRSAERPLKILILTKEVNDQIEIMVKDNGIGFDVQRHFHDIFGLYKRFHTHTPGRGVGLYLTKIQVEFMGGSVKMNSYPESGTTVTIKLPANQDGLNR